MTRLAKSSIASPRPPGRTCRRRAGSRRRPGADQREPEQETRNRNTNVNRNKNVNVNSNRNVNRNVNVDRDVDIDVDVDRHGCCYHHHSGWGVAAAVTTAVVVGSIVNTLPPSCTVVMVNGFTYQQCGNTCISPSSSGPAHLRRRQRAAIDRSPRNPAESTGAARTRVARRRRVTEESVRRLRRPLLLFLPDLASRSWRSACPPTDKEIAMRSLELSRSTGVLPLCCLTLLWRWLWGAAEAGAGAAGDTPTAGAPAETDLGAVKERFDTDETGGFVPTPKTKEELEVARKAYSPFRRTDVPDARLLSARPTITRRTRVTPTWRATP